MHHQLKLQQLQVDYKELKKKLGEEGASERAADLILEMISE